MPLPFLANALHGRFDSLDSDTKKKIAKVSGTVAGLIAIHKACIYTYRYVSDRRLRDRKLNQIQTTKGKLLQKLVGLKQPIENRDILTKLTYNELRDRIDSNDLTIIDVLEAYQAKALEIDRSLNCITDVIYDADVTALYLDKLPSEKRGRLHGIPLSVKDCVSQADYDSYYGCISRCFKPEKHTASIVGALVSEGMVPFARTNMSQGGMDIECDNPLFGATLNPYDKNRTSGGSSGGEGALIGSGGSIVGLGTDVSGSIRVPASFCGIYGIKPTCGRIGVRNAPKFENRVFPATYSTTIGPMSNDFDLLIDVMKVLFSPALFDLDESLPRLHFDNDAYENTAPMRIGMYKSFSDNRLCLESVPSVERAIELAKTALENRGHTVIEWEPPRIGYGCDLLSRCIVADGGQQLLNFRKNELFLSNPSKALCNVAFLNHHPWLRNVLAALLWFDSPLLARSMYRAMSTNSSHDLCKLIAEANAYKVEIARSWKEAGLDGVICPVLPYVAPLLGNVKSMIYGGLHCNLYNFLEYPGGSVPVTEVSTEDIEKLDNYPRRTSHHRKVIECQKDSIGMPVGVQCVALKWRDEIALRIMKEVKVGCGIAK